jgi:phosphoenolpyruvate carboxylase
VRAFTYFSHLANIAEDRHHNRCWRRRTQHGEPPDSGSLALAVARLKDNGITAEKLAETLRTVAISPVLTAHPTEVQRKSILDRHMALARLLAERGRPDLLGTSFRRTTPRFAAGDHSLAAANDAPGESRSAPRSTMCSHSTERRSQQLRHLYASAEFLIARCRWRSLAAPPVLRMGSWVGGDRDGNPFVDRDVLVYAVGAQARSCEPLPRRGAPSAPSSRLLGMARVRLRALANASPMRRIAAQTSLIGAASSALCAARRHDGPLCHVPPPRRAPAAPPYGHSRRLFRTSRRFSSLMSIAANLVSGRLRSMIHAVRLSSSTSPRWISVNSDVHER